MRARGSRLEKISVHPGIFNEKIWKNTKKNEKYGKIWKNTKKYEKIRKNIKIIKNIEKYKTYEKI